MQGQKPKIERYHLHRAHPEKLQFEVYDLKTYREENLEKASKPHSHSYYQLIWFLTGSGEHTLDFKTYAIRDNSVLFVSKDQIHFFDQNLDLTGWMIHFNESFFMHSDVDIFLKYNIFNTAKRPSYVIDEKTSEIAASYLALIREELAYRPRFGYEEVVRFLLKSFLINLERVHQKDENTDIGFNSHYELQFFKFKQCLEGHYASGLSVKGYADMLNISSKTLGTITKTIVGRSPSQLISERIVLEAKRMLKYTPVQIGELAFRLGFEDVSYFIKFFKRTMGCSPGVYRNQVVGK